MPGTITPETIAGASSRARNPLIAANPREFPDSPNIDAGEGVPMMFAEMARSGLYPPQGSAGPPQGCFTPRGRAGRSPALEAGRIKPVDSAVGTKLMRYLPHWA